MTLLTRPTQCSLTVHYFIVTLCKQPETHTYEHVRGREQGELSTTNDQFGQVTHQDSISLECMGESVADTLVAALECVLSTF